MRTPVVLFLLTPVLLVAGCAKISAGASDFHRNTPEVMRQYGCPSCHVIPAVAGASGKVGPSLEGVGQRSYLAGTLPNTPENMAEWIMHPQHLRPGTAMPEMGVTEQDAYRIVEFLERVR